MDLNKLGYIFFIATLTFPLSNCTIGLQNPSSLLQAANDNRHPKMEILRNLIEEKFRTKTKISQKNDRWKVTAESSTDGCAAGRLLLRIRSIKDENQGADIYLNFTSGRRDFDIMVDWADYRRSFLFYAPSDEAKMEQKINEPEFLEAVRWIIVAANVTGQEGLGMIAYYLLTWYPEERLGELFNEGLQMAFIQSGAVETYEGKSNETDSCEVKVSRDQEGNIFSVFIDGNGTNKSRTFWFNIFPVEKKESGACLVNNMFTNHNAVIDGTRKAQWTFAKGPAVPTSLFRTSFKNISEGNGRETLKILQQSVGYYSTIIGGSGMNIANTEIKLCMDNGRFERMNVVRKSRGFLNAAVITPIPLLGVSSSMKYTAECKDLKLVKNAPLLTRAQ